MPSRCLTMQENGQEGCTEMYYSTFSDAFSLKGIIIVLLCWGGNVSFYSTVVFEGAVKTASSCVFLCLSSLADKSLL